MQSECRPHVAIRDPSRTSTKSKGGKKATTNGAGEHEADETLFVRLIFEHGWEAIMQ